MAKTDCYIFSGKAGDAADMETVAKLRKIMKGSGYKLTLRGRKPKPGKSWRGKSGQWLPLYDAENFAAYAHETKRNYVLWNSRDFNVVMEERKRIKAYFEALRELADYYSASE